MKCARFNPPSLFLPTVLALVSPVWAYDITCGDVDRDGYVGQPDMGILLSSMGYSPGDPEYDERANLDCAGGVSQEDLAILLASYQTYCLRDSDCDRLADVYETDDGQFVGPLATGSDPFDNDTDDDNISDGDEVLGTELNLDLPAMGASPVRKDLFLEMDWTSGYIDPGKSRQMTAASAAAMVDAFAYAPVSNPYAGPMGISLHIDYGQGGAFTGGNDVGAYEALYLSACDPTPICGDLPCITEIYESNFDINRIGIFFYGIALHECWDSNCNSYTQGGQAGANWFYVKASNDPPSEFTTMHELGHGLGLGHGGQDWRNYKPNYRSVMNYRYSKYGIDVDGDAIPDGVLDYSSGSLVAWPLDEEDLNERIGISGIPIDWDGDGDGTEDHIARNITCVRPATLPCNQTSSICDDASNDYCEVLVDWNDWDYIQFRGPLEASFRNTVVVSECEGL